MTDFRGRRVLVTGGAGFIGSHLVEELVCAGALVTVLDNLVTGHLANLDAVAEQVELIEVSLEDADVASLLRLREPSIVFHLSGNGNVVTSVADPVADFAANVTATLHLLEAIRAVAPATPLVFTSSATVYGEGSGRPIAEDDVTTPVAPYGVSKLAAERYLSAYSRCYGLRTVTLRLFSLYGPRHRKQVVWDLMKKVTSDPTELRLFGDGSQERDFNHVANVIEAILLVADRARFEGEVYNAAGDEVVSIDEIARRICSLMGAQPNFVYSGDVRAGETQRWCADTTRIRELGYRPRLRLADGLQGTVAWFLKQADPGASPLSTAPVPTGHFLPEADPDVQ